MDPRACLLELCHDELPFAHLRPPDPGSTRPLGSPVPRSVSRVERPAWRSSADDPAKVPTLVLAGQMDPDISQPVLDEAITALDPGFLVTFDGLGSNVLRRECGREIQRLGLKTPAAT